MSTATTNKLKIKDIITVVLLALINVVIFFASSVLYATPITIILMPVFFALLEGIVYFIIGTKVKKPGAILIYSIVRAIMGGYLPYIILFMLSGVIAELLLWKMGYGNAKALTISYVINQVLAAFGSTIIPYAIAAKAMANQMVTDGRQDTILAASVKATNLFAEYENDSFYRKSVCLSASFRAPLIKRCAPGSDNPPIADGQKVCRILGCASAGTPN